MSDKFNALWIILNKLDKKEKVTARSLMEDLEVSERSVYRYITTLQVAGFPVDYDRAVNSYVFSDGYTLKKPDISVEETLALALSRKLLKSFGPDMERSLAKIEEKLSVKKPEDLRHIVLDADAIAPSETFLTLAHRAVINHQRINLKYKALHARTPRESKIDPYYLFFRDGIWYFRGYYHRDRAMRTFAFDRVVSLSLLNEYFVPQPVSPENELSGAFGAFLDGEPVEVTLQFDKHVKPFIVRKKWHESQKVKKLDNGKIEVKFKVNGLMGIKNWIYGWIPHVEVIAPRELRTALKRDLQKAIKLHGK
ncbi:MAG TPA: transcriptional regulator [Syntrophorhabdus sp.]|nr:transcriptional regulator [Syntrophorhabdus sp.]HOH27156.1 transcriptional regulator [Syntrophorhabdus sp.]